MKVWLRNAAHIHERLIAKYLRHKGWVAFYLDEQSRHCNKNNGVCWMEIYKNSK